MAAIRPRKKNGHCEFDERPDELPAVSRGFLRILTRTILPVSLAVILALLGFSVVAQTPSPTQVAIAPEQDAQALAIDRGAAGLWQLLLKLHTRASLIQIVAHPDDEDGGMLTYESRGAGARVALMTLNRGEGGQNVMNDEYWDALGLDRTMELLAADRYYGANQYWGTVIDYGFSKTKEEALQKWTHERVMSDAVRVVRMTRPLVVTSVFVGGPTDGHGHHQVSGEVAQEVFKAAGDPNAFPEQIKEGLRPWSPLKVYARVPANAVRPQGIYDSANGQWAPARFQDYVNNNWIEGLPAINLRIPEGTYDPLLGASYSQISREGWGFQKSQYGGPIIPEAGPASVPYHRFGSLVQSGDQEQSFFDGIDVSLAGIADLAKDGDAAFLRPALVAINAQIEQAMNQFSADHPEKIAPTLAEGLKATTALIDQVSASNLGDESKYDVLHELHIKQAQFNDALALALGFAFDAVIAPAPASSGGGPGGPFGEGGGEGGGFGPGASFQFAIPSQNFYVRVHAANQGAEAIELKRVWLDGPEGEMQDGAPGDDWKIEVDGKTQGGTLAGGSVVDQRFSVTVPENAAPTAPYFTRPNIEQPYYDLTDARWRNFSFAPYPLSAWAEFTYDGATVRVGQLVDTTSRQTGFGSVKNPVMVVPAISVAISPSAGIVPLGQKQFTLTVAIKSEAKGAAQGTVKLDLPEGWRATPPSAPFSTTVEGETQNVEFHIEPAGLAEKEYRVTAIATYDGKDYKSGFVTTGYPGLRPYNLYSPAEYRTSGVNVKMASGINVGYIAGTGDDVPATLETLGAHVHTLSAQDVASADLKKFDVIVMGERAYSVRPELAANNSRLLDYVKNGGVIVVQYQAAGPYRPSYGPYPLTIGSQIVVDEDSAVQILNPKDPTLSWPNQVTADDFKGWYEERGHGFVSDWDSHYDAPFEMHDAGQAPQKGGLLFARYGRGAYVYLAFALYRQLPEGVPGSYRLMANLLSLPRNPKLTSKSAQANKSTPPAAKPASKPDVATPQR
jgi:LmbE family N-acetylglucosaminyl deacetylase